MRSRRPRQWRAEPEPLRWPAPRLILAIEALWAVALGACLLVPSWHTGDRSWWPWCAVAALVLGALGYLYVRRGRGNAVHA